jgi:hypothetical protein
MFIIVRGSVELLVDFQAMLCLHVAFTAPLGGCSDGCWCVPARGILKKRLTICLREIAYALHRLRVPRSGIVAVTNRLTDRLDLARHRGSWAWRKPADPYG